jgi:DnaJ-class molecular chaperone
MAKFGSKPKAACRMVLRRAATHYSVLGLPPASPAALIKARYLQLAQQWHPDIGSNSDAEKFKELTAAYTIIGNEQRRVLYDRQLKLLGNQCPSCGGRGLTAQRGFKAVASGTTCEGCAGTGQATQNMEE